MKLKDKIAIVTGAGSGIGRASAQCFAAEGAKVVVVDINSKKANEAAEIIQGAGGQAISLVTDVCVENDVKKMIHDEGTKTIQFTDPKGKLYDKAWFLHLRVRSKEDWERKANEQSQWTYYRAKNNFKDWFDMFPRTIHTNSKHLDWFYHFNKFLS